MKVHLHLFILFLTSANQLSAQQDSSNRSTYFLEQSALTYPKGSLSYNNYYVLANSIAYNVTERLKVAAGVLIAEKPPFYVNVQYSFPVGQNVYLGGSVGFYQLDYTSSRSSYLIAPQVLCTIGDRQVNTTLSAGVVRGRFLLGEGVILPATFNLPDRVNLALSVSHRRPLSKELSLITQNAYISILYPSNKGYQDILTVSGGLGWHLQRSTLKGGLGAVVFPNGEQGRQVTPLPFVGYSYTIK
ncbi:hypothetical protein GCM10028817_35620 [Spirosoma pomorum]